MKIVFASGNAHKTREVKELLAESLCFPFELLSLKDVGFEGDIVEDGTTFEENSMIKAKTVYDFCRLPVIADDSGICVDALGGAPGIHSARYAAVFADKNSPDDTNTALLLRNMEGKTDRSARFVCAVSFVSEETSFTVKKACSLSTGSTTASVVSSTWPDRQSATQEIVSELWRNPAR
jgi:XTP/dITP diphosphohydrolase